MVNPFRPPVRRTGAGFVVKLGDAETEVLLRLLAELREMLTSDEPSGSPLLDRLFPVANPDDEEMEAEYQRLMRDELVQSRVASISIVEEILRDRSATVDEPRLTAFLQSVNAIRLVLGTMLDVSDDAEGDEVRPTLRNSPEHHLYGYLSWLLEHTVQALSGR